MIKKLRRNFVLIMMSVVTLILLAVFVSMLLAANGNARRMSENILRQALSAPPFPQRPLSAEPGRGLRDVAPPDARAPILVAETGANGEISFLTNQLYFIEVDEAETAVRAALNMKTGNGTLREYGLRFLRSSDGRRIALTDISMEQKMFGDLITNSLLIGGGALGVFLIVSILLARWAVRPVEHAWERQRQFVADASHELKTPLTVILSNAEMLSAAGTHSDEKQIRRIEHIGAEAARMKMLVEDLLTLAKSDSEKSAVAKSRVDFGFVVTNAILTFEPIIFDSCKKLAYDVRDRLFVMGDSQRLQQLITILLDNAVKYCPPGGNIAVSLEEGDKKNAVLTVTNDGEPIPREDLQRVFQRFYRADPSRSAQGGFGLGLAIAESIVREHGWEIVAQSGVGNSFIVTLKLCE